MITHPKLCFPQVAPSIKLEALSFLPTDAFLLNIASITSKTGEVETDVLIVIAS
jgi:hypothetical protein